MIVTTRKRIAVLLILVYLLSMAAVLTLFNVSYHRANTSDVSQSLTGFFRILTERRDEQSVELRMEPDGGAPRDLTMPPPEEESFTEARQIETVLRTEEGLRRYKSTERSAMSDSDVLAIAESILTQKKRSGTVQNWQYEISPWGDDLLIAFTDVSRVREQEQTMLARSVLIGLVSLAVWAVLAMWASGKLVMPLQTAMEKQAEFVAAAEHELKTPLSVLTTSLAMLRREGVESKYLAYAEEETKNMSALTAELLTLSQTEALKPALQSVDLGSCVAGAALPFEAAAYERGVTLTLSVEPDIHVFGDAGQLARLTGILIDNAVRHTERDSEVRVALTADGRLSVRNQGEAIPEDERERIFERFYRVDKSRSRAEGRYGLGLSIAQRIAENHKAAIRVDCRDGWTDFFVKFSPISR